VFGHPRLIHLYDRNGQFVDLNLLTKDEKSETKEQRYPLDMRDDDLEFWEDRGQSGWSSGLLLMFLFGVMASWENGMYPDYIVTVRYGTSIMI